MSVAIESLATSDGRQPIATRSTLEVRPRRDVALSQLPALMRSGPVRLADLEETAQNPDGILAIYTIVHELADARLVTFAAGAGPDCVAELRPMAAGFRLLPVPQRRLVLSRFAHVRRVDDSLVLESPLGVGSLRFCHPEALSVLTRVAAGAEPASLLELSEQRDDMHAFLELLVSGGFAGVMTDDGGAEQDEVPPLRQWEFHDLLFHSRTRLGRHDGEMGGTYRFAGRIDPADPIPVRTSPTTIPLARPARAPRLDNNLTGLLAHRSSVREHGQVAISLRELGELLHHSARILDLVPGPMGPLTSRPYPNGGASYELEIYLVVDRCLGLAPGFYYYDAALHGLAPMQGPNDDTAALLEMAYVSSGGCRPQVLLTVAARFQRVSWKYAGIAYATTLKNLGALYATLYLVATAMGLAPCALGLGDSERFCRLAGTDRYTESTVGEFMIGSRS
jgi:oxazoline/thiazoline dehydrogenase